MFTADNDSALL